MTNQQVRTLAGDPLGRLSALPRSRLLVLRPKQKDITIHAIRFCFANGRVSLIPGSSG